MGIFSKSNFNHEIDAHVWIGAFALAQVVIALVFLSKINELTETVSASALVQEQTTREVAALQQEIAALRQPLDSARAEPSKKADHDAPTRTEHGDTSARGRTKN